MRLSPRLRLAAVAAAAAGAAAALGACHGGPNSSPGAGSSGGSGAAAVDDGWVDACLGALEQARAAPDARRAGLIVDGCRPCGVAWDPVTAADVPAPSKVVAVVDACRLGCPRTARSNFYAAVSALEPGSSPRLAWKALGAACPAVLGAADHDGRFAGGAWFALEQIGRRLGEARPRLAPAVQARLDRALGVALPLPAVSIVGTGFDVPGGAGGACPTAAISVTSATASVGALPWARLGAAGLEVAPGWAWPGDPVAPADLPKAVAAIASPGPVAIDAPAGLTAAHVLDVAAALGPDQHAALAVAAARTDAGFAHVLRAGPVPLGPRTGARLAVTARADAIAAVDAHGKVVAAAALPGADPAGRLHAVADLVAGAKVVAIAPGDATATDLAATLDALAELHAGIAAEPAAPGAWPAPGPLAAVRAAEAGSP